MAVLEELYRAKQKDFSEKLAEQTDPHTVYVTDLASCSHKRVLRRLYPLLAFRFEPHMLIGDLVHMGLASLLTSTTSSGGRWVAEVEVVREYMVYGETYRLKGRADLVYYQGDRPVTVVEVKTSRSMPRNEPLEHHELQLQIYMELLGVDQGYLIYVTPDRLVEYPVERASVDVEALVRETIDNARRPRYEWECSYCPFNRFCPYALTAR